MTVPFPDPVVVALLVQHFGDEVGDRVSIDTVGLVPSLRVSNTGDREAPSNWERTPIFQVEVWHSSAFAAGTLATRIANEWPSIRRVNVAGAFVSGAWVETNPRPLPADDTDLARYFLEVGLRLH